MQLCSVPPFSISTALSSQSQYRFILKMAKFYIAITFLALTLYSVQCQVPSCPPPTGNPVFFPDPADCSRYYMCTDLVPTHMQCPPPLLWDQRISACNHPGSVQCTPVTTTTTTTTTTESPTTEAEMTTYEDISTTEV